MLTICWSIFRSLRLIWVSAFFENILRRKSNEPILFFSLSPKFYFTLKIMVLFFFEEFAQSGRGVGEVITQPKWPMSTEINISFWCFHLKTPEKEIYIWWNFEAVSSITFAPLFAFSFFSFFFLFAFDETYNITHTFDVCTAHSQVVFDFIFVFPKIFLIQASQVTQNVMWFNLNARAVHAIYLWAAAAAVHTAVAIHIKSIIEWHRKFVFGVEFVLSLHNCRLIALAVLHQNGISWTRTISWHFCKDALRFATEHFNMNQSKMRF